jgi:hypothetical protein
MTPFREGFQARQRDDDIAANPYPIGTKEHAQWRDGWMDLEEHYAARDEVIDW